jgi:hypothetical protein
MSSRHRHRLVQLSLLAVLVVITITNFIRQETRKFVVSLST